MPLSPAELDRYSRHLLLHEVGSRGQERLKAGRVLLVGAGGLGSPAALYLAAAGIGTIGIIDDDAVALSNLQRQVLFRTRDVGASKVAAAREHLGELNPEIAIEAHPTTLAPANAAGLVGTYDVIVDGSDRIATRYLVNDACVLLGKPLATAAIHRFEGQAMVYAPGRGPCYRCLFPEAAEAAAESCAEAGVLGVLPGVLGTIVATEALKLFLGVGEPLIGRLLTYDALAMTFREFPVVRRSDCAVCGDAPVITRLQGPVRACGAQPPEVRSITGHELAQLMDHSRTGKRPVVVIDVREPHEFEFGHLDGAVSIPLALLEQRLAAYATGTPVVFVCRSGARSARACGIARGRGFGDAINLSGGLIAWAATLDPDLPIA
jgi:adenylyltransferase/sulfurtransferase